MSYSLWIVPAEEKVKSYLTSLITDLAHQYEGPLFEPHATIIGDVNLPLEQIKAGCQELAATTKPFSIETGAVEYSTTYYQCLFVRLKPNPVLMTLYDATKRVFGLTKPSVYMPHLSLFYGHVSYATRHQMMNSLIFQPQRLSVQSLVVTPGGEHPPSEWAHVSTHPFTVGIMSP